MNIGTVILAAGKGTRMKSRLPKVLHPILGKPMLWYVVDACRQVSSNSPVVVIGYQAEAIQTAFGNSVEYALQEEQLGTAHALQQAQPLLDGKYDHIIVTYGDMPLISVSTLQALVDAHLEHDGPITMLTIELDDPHGFGRVVRNEDGNVVAIVEEAVATDNQKAIRELNSGVYCFDANWVWDALTNVGLSPKGEYYLTDLVEIAVNSDLPVQAIRAEDASELIGINTRVHLAEATKVIQQRVNNRLMLSGVTILDPDTAYIEPDVIVGQDTTILPNTHIMGNSIIGEACEIGPNALIRNSQIGNGCKVLASVVEDAVMEDNADIGPFGHLRKGAHLAEGVHMGNFGEVKDSYLGPGTKMGHFSYIGNATIGANVNIGAGTITCNYDGKRKHPTTIGDGAFIGSDTMLVAPVKVGNRARTGAGSVVTKNIPDDTLAVGVPARSIRKIESEEKESSKSGD